MILRKPYAFLIKRFKLIHLILLALTIFVNYKTSIISSFFRNYVSNNYSAVITPNFSDNFISIPLYLAIIGLILILVAMVYLLQYKKKKPRFYYLAVIYNIILLGFIIFIGLIFTTLERDVISADAARLYRDIALIIYLPQFILIGFFGIRALGFNIKQFNFKEDLKELELGQADNEEVEVNINFDTYKAKRGFRRFIRETSYYVRENKFMVTIVSIVLVIVLVYAVVTNISSFEDTTVRMNQPFSQDGLLYTIEDVVFTNVDLNGEIIKEDKYYLLLKIKIENNSIYDVKIDSNDFKLYTSGTYITPKINISSKFSDYGTALINTNIYHENSDVYVLPYEVDENNINNNYQLKLYKGSTTENGISYPVYNTMNINPEILKNNQFIDSANIAEELKFDESTIGSSKMKINSYEVTNNYYYEAEDCKEDKCTTYTDVVGLDLYGTDSFKTLLVLDGIIELDKTTTYFRNNNLVSNFIDNFLKIEYTYNDKVFIEEVDGVNLTNLDGKIVLKVPKEIKDSPSIKLEIKIRNLVYEYVIKN